MPHHSLFNWIVYAVWTLGFGVTIGVILRALLRAIDSRTRYAARIRAGGANGFTLIEATRAVRNEAIRLAIAIMLTLLGLWAITISDSPGGGSVRGRITLIFFLLLGALVCSSAWLDRADDAKQMRH